MINLKNDYFEEKSAAKIVSINQNHCGVSLSSGCKPLKIFIVAVGKAM